MSERTRRRWAAVEAVSLGRGGISVVSAATGLGYSTIQRGIRELNTGDTSPTGRQRRLGAGRKRTAVVDPGVKAALERLVEPESRGDPQSPLRWTCKSTRRLAQELTSQGHPIGPTTVRQLLKEAGYSLQANRKTREGKESHPDRDAQFRFISGRVKAQQRRGQPAISGTRRKRKTWEISRIQGKLGVAKVSLWRWIRTIFQIQKKVKRSPTASTICVTTRLGSMLASAATRPNSQSNRFVVGGNDWEGGVTARQRGC